MVLTNRYLDKVKQIITDQIVNEWTYGAVGTDNTTPTVNDTALGNEVLRKERTDYERETNNNYVIVSLFISSTEANGNLLKEVGWFDSSTAGNLWFRDTFPEIDKTADIEIWIDTKIEIAPSEVRT